MIPACTELLVFDFEMGRRVMVKLWRGLAAWYSSLSLGCRLQIRSLTLKSQSNNNINELHSSSTTEIHLLAHGPGGKGKAVSGRAGILHDKEAAILNFLNHQSLLIPFPFCNKSPATTSLKNNVNINLISPVYLEYHHQIWTLQSSLVTVNFIHLDAKVWQKLLEIIDILGNFDFSIQFNNLVQSEPLNLFNFTSDSSFDLAPNIFSSCPTTFKSLDWKDLCSSQVVLYGVYSLKSLVKRTNSSSSQGTSEESLGNLSIDLLPSFTLKLKCPHDDKYFIYPENGCGGFIFDESRNLFSLLVLVKTVLNDGNVNEIIRKSVYILKIK